MTSLAPARLARPMARHPLRWAVAGGLTCLLGAVGFVRFSVDAGTGLLVGSGSTAGQAYSAFTRDFGSDPIVVVLTPNPACLPDAARRVVAPAAQVRAAASCLYDESNVIRLAAVESDVAHDPRVASVLGPGTIAGASLQGLQQQVTVVELEYGEYFADLARIQYLQQNHLDATKLSSQQQQQLSQVEQSTAQTAIAAIGADVVRATAAAEQARRQVDAAHDPAARIVDAPERAAQQAVDAVGLPPGFADFVARLQNLATADAETAARRLFDNFAAAYGVCNQQVAQALGVPSTCQAFIQRFLLDLPNCPTVADFERTGAFCQPKPQWSAALPRPRPGQPPRAVITVRLRRDAVGNGAAVRAVLDRITGDLAATHPPHTVQPYVPITCGDAPPTLPPAALPPFSCVVAGSPLLAQGVVGVTTHLLAGLVPVALLLMLVILLGALRVRGRVWPLLAAGLATLLTLGVTLGAGVAITPAVLAGVPVLVGLGVDYGVQLVARFAEERGRGMGVEAALRRVLERTGPATLVAATATLVGLLGLAGVSGIDLGPLAAVPFVAQFALVLSGGIVVAWASALFVALPVAAWRERRAELLEGRRPPTETSSPPPARRTLALADRWRLVVVPAAAVAVVGWIALPRVPVQTDVEKLLAPSLSELRAVNTVRDQTGYSNELDLYLRGDVVGATSASPVPDQVDWQGRVASQIVCDHPAEVALAVSIADVLTANAATPSTSAQRRCPGSPSSSPVPTPSPGLPGGATSPSGPTPGASPAGSGSGPSPTSGGAPTTAPGASPQALGPDGVVRTSRIQPPAAGPEAQATAPGQPSASPEASPGGAAAGTASAASTPGAAPTPLATPRATPSAGAPTTPAQGPFVCTLRTFAVLSRVLVNGFTPQTAACPPIDVFTRQALASDGTPVTPTAARIVLGVRATSLDAEANLVHSLRADIGSPPAGITSVEPSGLAALAVAAYDTVRSRSLLLNLFPLVLVAGVLMVLYRDPRRALLPVLPTALAAGWAPLVVTLFGRLPYAEVLGALNPLTVVLGALVVALATEFGVVVLSRFDEERRRGLGPEDAAAATLAGVGGSVGVSAATLAGGFAVLALGGLIPPGLPLIADFGLEVVVDLALAVLAVFAVMLPLAVVVARTTPETVAAAAVEPEVPPSFVVPPRGGEQPMPMGASGVTAVSPVPADQPTPGAAVAPVEVPATPTEATAATSPPVRRLPGVSGRRRTALTSPRAPAPETPVAAAEALPQVAASPRRLPGISGRPRVASVPPPPQQGPSPGRRRLPGGVVPRRTRSEPSAPLPPVTPAAPPPSSTPAAGGPAPGTPEAETGAPRPRSRRRRPPPHVRRRTREGGPPPGGRRPDDRP